jgi:hypothetical protein
LSSAIGSDQTQLSIQVHLDGFSVFTHQDSASPLSFTQFSTLKNWLQNQNSQHATRLVYTTPATLIPEELFQPNHAADYLKYHFQKSNHVAYSALKSIGLMVVFSVDQDLEKELGSLVTVMSITHSGYELVRRALASPHKEWLRFVTIFHPEHLEVVFHKGNQLISYNQFPIHGELDCSYYLKLLQTQSSFQKEKAAIICYENGSQWGQSNFKTINDWASDAQYITEIYPFI